MNVTKIVSRVKRWQKINTVHSLTCGNDSNHQNLVAIDYFKKPLLLCKDCDYQQEVPDMFLHSEIDEFMDQQENLDKILRGFVKE